MALIIHSKAPNLPIGPDEYNRQYVDTLLATLRIYFNQLDNTVGQVVGVRGGGFLNAPYAAIQRNTNKTFTPNTATEITFETNDFLNGCENDGTNGIRVLQSGLYNYQFSVQWSNSDSQEHDAWIWLRVNNTDAVGTGSQFTIPSKHGLIDGHLIAAANFYVYLNGGDYVKMFSAVSATSVIMQSYPAKTTPFAMPSVPSIVATLSFVSAVI